MPDKNTIESFDRERGDVLVLPASLAAMLVKMGPEVATGIVWEFLTWFAGGVDRELKDMRDNGILEILKDNQRRSAESVYQRRLSQREKSAKRWTKEVDPEGCRGMPRDAAGIKEKKQGERKEKQKASLSDSRIPAPSECAALGGAPGAPIPFPSPRYQDALAVAEREPSSINCSKRDLEDLSRDPATTILRLIREENRTYSRNTIIKFLTTLGKGVVIDTFLELLEDDKVRASSRGKVLFGRLKNIAKTL